MIEKFHKSTQGPFLSYQFLILNHVLGEFMNNPSTFACARFSCVIILRCVCFFSPRVHQILMFSNFSSSYIFLCFFCHYAQIHISTRKYSLCHDSYTRINLIFIINISVLWDGNSYFYKKTFLCVLTTRHHRHRHHHRLIFALIFLLLRAALRMLV